MNFSNHIGKATETACEFLERSGGQINVMKLMKLCYLLDRPITRSARHPGGGRRLSLDA